MLDSEIILFAVAKNLSRRGYGRKYGNFSDGSAARTARPLEAGNYLVRTNHALHKGCLVY